METKTKTWESKLPKPIQKRPVLKANKPVVASTTISPGAYLWLTDKAKEYEVSVSKIIQTILMHTYEADLAVNKEAAHRAAPIRQRAPESAL